MEFAIIFNNSHARHNNHNYDSVKRNFHYRRLQANRVGR